MQKVFVNADLLCYNSLNETTKTNNTMSLIMSKNRIDASCLANLNTPAGTDTHTPIPHATLVDYTRKALDRAGLEITREEHGLAQGDLCYFGGFAITGKEIQGDDRNLVVGIRNSHNKRFAGAICIGNNMIVCDNLCFSSDIKLARRHTPRILEDLPRVLATAISRCTSHWTDMGKRITAYQESEITRQQASDLLIDLVDSKAFSARDVYKTVKEFEAPRHAEFKGNTLWNLYNACTEHLKDSDMSKLPARTMTIQSTFDRLAGHQPNIIDVEDAVILPS